MDKRQEPDHRHAEEKTEIQPFEESTMEPKRLSDARRKQLESDQHTVGGF